MDTVHFDSTLAGIHTLNGTEGPSRNIFEPKFQARAQAETLKKAIEAKIKSNQSLLAQDQLSRCFLFLGNNYFETEEDDDALKLLGTAYQLSVKCIVRETLDLDMLQPTSAAEILKVNDPICTSDNEYEFVSTYVDVLNSLGVFLAQREEQLRIEDSKKVLHVAEQCYLNWDAWFLKQPNGCKMEDISFDENDKVVPLDGKDAKQRHKMDGLYTSNLFYLAQAYSLKQDVRNASKYCHLTMVRQLLSKKEFDKKDWATNALQLSSFYSTEAHYGCALHCLEAGKYIMPTKPADEETIGIVAWAFAKFHKGRLGSYSARVESGNQGNQHATAQHDEIGRTEWWVDFPIPIDSPTNLHPINDYESAKKEFIIANTYMNDAKKYYLYDGSCTDHIKILQDQAELLRMLSIVEPNFERKLSMQMLRVKQTAHFPTDLNPQAYTTLIRQLHFDLGDANSDLLDLRIVQRKQSGSGKPFSDRKMNKLCDRSKKCFWDFLETFKERGAKDLPVKVETDLQVPFFRCLMRIAGLETKRFHSSPKEEFDSIGKAVERYQECVKFANNNSAGLEQLEHEVSMAKEMATLLPGKQKEIMRLHAH